LVPLIPLIPLAPCNEFNHSVCVNGVSPCGTASKYNSYADLPLVPFAPCA
jgi:hypothetical protein